MAKRKSASSSSKIERLLAELRAAPPYRREDILAEVASTYREGFAAALRRHFESEQQKGSA